MNLVAIVGRPNVGKSTLFNRLVGQRDAIIEAEPGVTRDRIYGKSHWNGKEFDVIDTGGFIPGAEDEMEKAIREQAEIAIEESDSIIFMVDGRDGITKFDEEIGRLLRNTKKPVTLVVNKCDNEMMDAHSYEFYKLGLGEPFPISANNGRSTGDFMDHLVEPLEDIIYDDEDILKVAFVGRPNVGKSSLTNALLGEERMIVTNIPGTTRDSIDTKFRYYGEDIVLIDTAGLRRKAKITENIEMWSTVRTARAIDRCDVAVLLIDGVVGLEDQDKRIINQINDARKGMIIAVNKWDLIDKDGKTADLLTKIIREELRTFNHVPIVYISATDNIRVNKVVDLAKDVLARRKTRISTSKLNAFLMPVFDRTPPPSFQGFDMRINYVTQVGTEPPVFALFLNRPENLKSEYKRFIENRIRDEYGFQGTPISLLFRSKN